MKRTGFTLINLIILGIGILFIAASRRPDFIRSLVFFTGIAFIVPGVINLFTLLLASNKAEEDAKAPEKKERPSAWSRFVGWTVSIAAVVLGAMMCFTPETFHSPLVYIFALFIFIGGIYHLYMMLRGLRPVTFDLWTFIFPVALIALAVVLFFVPSLHLESGQATVALLTGISLIIFAMTSFFESVGIRAYNKRVKNAATTTDITHVDSSTPIDVTPADSDHTIEKS